MRNKLFNYTTLYKQKTYKQLILNDYLNLKGNKKGVNLFTTIGVTESSYNLYKLINKDKQLYLNTNQNFYFYSHIKKFFFLKNFKKKNLTTFIEMNKTQNF